MIDSVRVWPFPVMGFIFLLLSWGQIITLLVTCIDPITRMINGNGLACGEYYVFDSFGDFTTPVPAGTVDAVFLGVPLVSEITCPWVLPNDCGSIITLLRAIEFVTILILIIRGIVFETDLVSAQWMNTIVAIFVPILLFISVADVALLIAFFVIGGAASIGVILTFIWYFLIVAINAIEMVYIWRNPVHAPVVYRFQVVIIIVQGILFIAALTFLILDVVNVFNPFALSVVLLLVEIQFELTILYGFVDNQYNLLARIWDYQKDDLGGFFGSLSGCILGLVLLLVTVPTLYGWFLNVVAIGSIAPGELSPTPSATPSSGLFYRNTETLIVFIISLVLCVSSYILFLIVKWWRDEKWCCACCYRRR